MRVEPKVTAMVFALLLCGLLVLPGYGAARFKSVTYQEPEMPSQAEQTMFTKGQSLYSQGLYGEAISVFNDLLKAYPKSLIRDLALLWLGRSYIRQGDVPSAEQVGLRLREIPDTPFVSFYEEELRVARQNYVRSAAPPDKSKPSRPPQRLETKSTTAEAATEGADQNQTSRGRPTKSKAAAKVETDQKDLTGQRATQPPTERVPETASAVPASKGAAENDKSRANSASDATARRLAKIDAVSSGLSVRPGDTVYVPFVVSNPGRGADSYELVVTGALDALKPVIYADTNGDGAHQENEPAVTKTPQLDPQSGQYPILLRAQIPADDSRRQKYVFNVLSRSENDRTAVSEAGTTVTVVAPSVSVRTEQITRVAASGGAIFYRLVVSNEGNGDAKNLTVSELLNDSLEFASSDPAPSRQEPVGRTQRLIFRLSELEPGETKVLRIAVRLNSDARGETGVATKHSVIYHDSKGNTYRSQ